MNTSISILPILIFFFTLIQFSSSIPFPDFEPSPAPFSSDGIVFPPAETPRSDATEVIGAPVLAPGEWRDEDGDEGSGEIGANPPSPEEAGSAIRWCAVRDDLEECEHVASALKKSEADMADTWTWKCIKRDTTQECLASIKKGEADIVNLDAGLAYIAFTKYSMKAIANEVYCNHANTYATVAIVNRKSCMKKEATSLTDFEGKKSCHGSYSTASGWNYPITHIKRLIDSKSMNDREIVMSFFSEACAPSEFEGLGICSGCGNENGLCNSDSGYFGHSGAFRCLLEELGDIAFVREDTALLYSMEGPQNQSWSTKSIRDFMYLCPQGGCREINGYPGSCSYGSVPANVIMASNSISREKRSVILRTLLNTTWLEVLYARINGASNSQLLSSSTQRIAAVKKITRSYLGKSASISKSIQELNTIKDVNVVSLSGVSHPRALHIHCPVVITIISMLIMLEFPVFPLS